MLPGTKDEFSWGNEKISTSRNRNLPPFSAIRAFEAAARHLSFTLAADELCVSPSAISHQIRALERYLATSLFQRDGNRVALSMTGEAYAGRMTDLLDNLADSTEQIRPRSSDGLRVLCTPGFAARWLLPRLPRFHRADAVRLRIADGAPSTNFSSNDADVVIKWRDDPQDGVAVWPLLASARTPVAAPGFARRHGIDHPQDLLRVTLFKDQTDDMWPNWFAAAGVVGITATDGPQYPNCEYATTAAEAGLGVALAYDAVVRDTISEGRLLRLFEIETAPFTIYAIACDQRRSENKTIRDFRHWLLEETKADGTLPDTVPPKTGSRH